MKVRKRYKLAKNQQLKQLQPIIKFLKHSKKISSHYELLNNQHYYYCESKHNYEYEVFNYKLVQIHLNDEYLDKLFNLKIAVEPNLTDEKPTYPDDFHYQAYINFKHMNDNQEWQIIKDYALKELLQQVYNFILQPQNMQKAIKHEHDYLLCMKLFFENRDLIFHNITIFAKAHHCQYVCFNKYQTEPFPYNNGLYYKATLGIDGLNKQQIEQINKDWQEYGFQMNCLVGNYTHAGNTLSFSNKKFNQLTRNNNFDYTVSPEQIINTKIQKYQHAGAYGAEDYLEAVNVKLLKENKSC